MKYPAAHEPVEPVVFAAGDEHLPARDAVEHIFLPLRIQLAEHVVEQHHRILPDGVFMDLPVGQLHRQRRRAHLAL